MTAPQPPGVSRRVVLRGADAITFLASHGVTFTLPYGQTKDSMPTGWNRSGAGVGADEAIAHYQQKNNVGALAENVAILDIDFDFPAKVAELGSLACTAKIWRDNAKERGALIYKLVDGPVRSANWIPAGETEPHAELKAQTKNGNYLQKNVAGFHKGGEYCIVDTQLGIKEITRAELILIWAVITDTELYAPKPAKLHPEGTRTKPTAPRGFPRPVSSHDDLVAQVKTYWSPLAVFERHGLIKNGTEEKHGSVRILGHGGLIITGALWHSFADDKGGDAIDAWAKCTRRERDLYFRDIIEEMADAAGIDVPRPPYLSELAPLPEGATVLDNGIIVLKTTPIPEPTPRPKPPTCTPAICATLRQMLNSLKGRELLHALKNREIYVAALSVLLTKAPQLGGWIFNIRTRDLGTLLGKTAMSASRNLHTLARVGLVAYRHGVAQIGTSDAPPMSIDLSPIVCKLLGVTGVDDTADVTDIISTSCNVYARYTGDGEFADATMRANPMTKGLHGRTLRSLSASALNGLDLVARGELALTRRMLVDELGMSPGSAAGATRVYTELGIATVCKIGRSNEYVFDPDWQEQLQALVPKMVSFLASYRIKIRNVSDRIVEAERHIRQLGGDPKRVREEDSPPVRDLHTRRKKLLFVRKQLMGEMEAKDLAHRPQATPAPTPGQWVGTQPRPPHRANKRSARRHITEGELLERRLALYATIRESKEVAA